MYEILIPYSCHNLSVIHALTNLRTLMWHEIIAQMGSLLEHECTLSITFKKSSAVTHTDNEPCSYHLHGLIHV